MAEQAQRQSKPSSARSPADSSNGTEPARDQPGEASRSTALRRRLSAMEAWLYPAVDRRGSHQVSRRLASITLDNLHDLPHRCRRCVFWELDSVGQAQALETGDPVLEKEAWVSSVLLEWGSCGEIVYVDGAPAGYLLYAPPRYAPRSYILPSGPVSSDAVLLMTGHVMAEFAGGGLGRMLVQGVAKDLTRRGIKAIEAFGDLRWSEPACVVPADYLLAVGFKTVRQHPRYPRLRLELRTTLSWREDVEAALERLLGSMQPERALGLA